ncbi:MAG: cupin [Ponticaulis sp.]|nr:cupin [Ponticaulis sp.]|tara:strand:+ start:38751 stop:39125 length:375 start_codon:yes stop_codon:yes gene_type:complete
MSNTSPEYEIKTDTLMHAADEFFDIVKIGDEHTPWWNRTLCAVNNAWVRPGVMEGDFHWQKRDDEDEFFLVLEGHLDFELEDRMVSLKPRQAFTVPKGVTHFPHARERSVVLMVEQDGVVPMGN